MTYWFWKPNKKYFLENDINTSDGQSFCIGDFVRKKKILRNQEIFCIKGIVKTKQSVRFWIETLDGQYKGQQFAENLVLLCRPTVDIKN